MPTRMGKHGVGCPVDILEELTAVNWSRSYPKFHMSLWVTIALAWLILGANSGNVPWGTDLGWLLTNAAVAGTALGVAHRGTQSSMLIYLLAALAAGSIRSIAYLANGSTGPGCVWLIVALTNIVLLGQWKNRNGGHGG